MELDEGSDPVVGEESRRAVLPTTSREEEPSDRLEPTKPVDSSTLLLVVGVLVELAS